MHGTTNTKFMKFMSKIFYISVPASHNKTLWYTILKDVPFNIVTEIISVYFVIIWNTIHSVMKVLICFTKYVWIRSIRHVLNVYSMALRMRCQSFPLTHGKLQSIYCLHKKRGNFWVPVKVLVTRSDFIPLRVLLKFSVTMKSWIPLGW